MKKAVKILDEKLNKYKTKISFSVDMDAILEAMEEYAKQFSESGGAVVSQDNTSDIIDASYYCAHCKGQGKIIIKPSIDKDHLLVRKGNYEFI